LRCEPFHILFRRDIKTTNVLIDSEWHAKLCDFSFGCHDTSLSKEEFIYGTDEFMSPEVALAQPFGLPADIFSYGILLCEVMTGPLK
jgi:LIM domain kinase 1